MAKAATKNNDSSANIGFEAKLWLAADKLRNNMDAAEYGKQVLKALTQQLSGEFGRGFSRSNLEYMRKFFLIYRDRLPDKSQMLSGVLPEAAPLVQRPVAQTPFRLSWSQYVFLMPARRAKHRHMLRMGYDL